MPSIRCLILYYTYATDVDVASAVALLTICSSMYTSPAGIAPVGGKQEAPKIDHSHLVKGSSEEI